MAYTHHVLCHRRQDCTLRECADCGHQVWLPAEYLDFVDNDDPIVIICRPCSQRRARTKARQHPSPPLQPPNKNP